MTIDPLDQTAGALQTYAASITTGVPRGLVSAVIGALDAEPLPHRRWGWIALPRSVQRTLRVAALAAIIALGVGGALFAGQLASLLREVRVGTTPSPPAVIIGPSTSTTAAPSPSPSPSSTPRSTRTPEPSVVVQPTPPVTFETPGVSPVASGSPGASEDSGGGNRGPGGGG